MWAVEFSTWAVTAFMWAVTGKDRELKQGTKTRNKKKHQEMERRWGTKTENEKNGTKNNNQD